jgi:hypothetical protein
MQRQSEFDSAKIRTQMSAGFGDRSNDEVANLARKLV